jgi:hypothetical protein
LPIDPAQRRTGVACPQLPAAGVHILPGRLTQLGQHAARQQRPGDRLRPLCGRPPEVEPVDAVERDQVQAGVSTGQQPDDAVELERRRR